MTPFREAFTTLLQAGYNPRTCTMNGKIIAIEVYSSALSMDHREKLIRELLPDFKVNGIKHLEIINIEQ